MPKAALFLSRFERFHSEIMLFAKNAYTRHYYIIHIYYKLSSFLSINIEKYKLAMSLLHTTKKRYVGQALLAYRHVKIMYDHVLPVK